MVIAVTTVVAVMTEVMMVAMMVVVMTVVMTVVMMVAMTVVVMVDPRTNPTAKQLHCVMVRGTAVDVTGCIILLQFCPKLTKVLFINITLDTITILRVGDALSMRVLEMQSTH